MESTASLTFYQRKLRANTRFWWSCFSIPTGITGNILCLLVVSQKHNHSISCSVYMGALAVCDTLFLAANALQTYIPYLGDEMLITNHVICCKASAFVSFTSSQCGNMIILGLLLERVIAVTKPLKAAILLSRKRSLIIVFIIFILLAAFNVPHILSWTAKTKPINRCTYMIDSLIVTPVYSMFAMFINGILPLFGILIMNLIILCVIKSKRGRRKQSKKRGLSTKKCSVTEASTTDVHPPDISTISSANINFKAHDVSDVDIEISLKRDAKTTKMENQLTTMTVVMTAAFFICVAPYYILAVLYVFPNAGNPLALAWTATICRNLILLNSGINFYLYALSGSKFRSDVTELFCTKRH